MQLAGCCEALNSEQAVELRRAAILMTPTLAEALEERASIMEFDGQMSREQAEAAVATDVAQ